MYSSRDFLTLQECILYKKFEFIENFVNCGCVNQLTTIQKEKILTSVIDSYNEKIIKLFETEFSNLQEVVLRRRKLISQNKINCHDISNNIYIGLVYECKLVIDPITNLEDIIDDYYLFEKFTDISLLDNYAINKINDFFNNSLSNEELHFLQNLKHSYVQRKFNYDNVINCMNDLTKLDWKLHIIKNNYGFFNFTFDEQENVLLDFIKYYD